MAVQNYLTNYTESFVDAVGKHTGVRLHYLQKTVAVAAADDDTSTYLLFKDVPFNARIAKLLIENDAITGGTDYVIGLYDSDTGAVKSANCLATTLDLSSGHTKTSPLDGLKAVTHANTLKCLYELAGDTLSANGAKGRYDVVLTANTAGSGAGSVTARMELTPAG